MRLERQSGFTACVALWTILTALYRAWQIVDYLHEDEKPFLQPFQIHSLAKLFRKSLECLSLWKQSYLCLRGRDEAQVYSAWLRHSKGKGQDIFQFYQSFMYSCCYRNISPRVEISEDPNNGRNFSPTLDTFSKINR